MVITTSGISLVIIRLKSHGCSPGFLSIPLLHRQGRHQGGAVTSHREALNKMPDPEGEDADPPARWDDWCWRAIWCQRFSRYQICGWTKCLLSLTRFCWNKPDWSSKSIINHHQSKNASNYKPINNLPLFCPMNHHQSSTMMNQQIKHYQTY